MVKVIAEPDVSHEGDIHNIYEGIRQAAKAGASFYKLQCYDVEKLGCNWAHKYHFYKKCAVDDETIKEANLQCARYGMELVCTVNDPDQVARVVNLGITNIKLASGQVCKDILGEVDRYREKITRLFVSTGMQGDSGLSILFFDFEDLYHCGIEIILMHCVSLYPPHPNEINILRMEEIYNKFKRGKNCRMGYSDHTGNVTPGVVAVSLGADYLEYHVHLEGAYSPVEQSACSYDDLKRYITTWKVVEEVLGDGLIAAQEREDEVYEKYKDRWVW